jgi:hypothetical protein
MANIKVCVNVQCNRAALYHRRTLCLTHYRDPAATTTNRLAVAPTTLSEWEWIKKELKL